MSSSSSIVRTSRRSRGGRTRRAPNDHDGGPWTGNFARRLDATAPTPRGSGRRGGSMSQYYSSGERFSPSTWSPVTPPPPAPLSTVVEGSNSGTTTIGSAPVLQRSPSQDPVDPSYLRQRIQNGPNIGLPDDARIRGLPAVPGEMPPPLSDVDHGPVLFSIAAQEALGLWPRQQARLTGEDALFLIQQIRGNLSLNEAFQRLEQHQMRGRAILEILARRKYLSNEPNSAGGEQDNLCAICLDGLANGNYLAKLDCDHDYHFDCIKEWIKNRNQCPMCREPAISDI